MKKMSLKRKKQSPAPSGRITNETVAEHREHILAGGRQFKYPLQYTKHKVVINAVLISVIGILLFVLLGWVLLYPMQNTSDMAYRVTHVLSLPVADVDGEKARYSDYLIKYRASEYFLSKYGESKVGSSDWETQLNAKKRESIDEAEMTAFARKLAKQHNISVSEEEVDEIIDKGRNAVNGRVSQETYDASIRMALGMSSSEYRITLRNAALRSKVAFAIDDKAKAQADSAKKTLSETGDFAKSLEVVNAMPGGKANLGNSGEVSSGTHIAGLRVDDLFTLNVGEISGIIKSVNDEGYYIVKIISKSGKKIAFEYIHIPLTTFKTDFNTLKKENKIREFINIPQKTQNATKVH